MRRKKKICAHILSSWMNARHPKKPFTISFFFWIFFPCLHDTLHTVSLIIIIVPYRIFFLQKINFANLTAQFLTVSKNFLPYFWNKKKVIIEVWRWCSIFLMSTFTCMYVYLTYTIYTFMYSFIWFYHSIFSRITPQSDPLLDKFNMMQLSSSCFVA